VHIVKRLGVIFQSIFSFVNHVDAILKSLQSAYIPP